MKKINYVSLFFDAALSLIACFLGSYTLFAYFGSKNAELIFASIGSAVALSGLWLTFLNNRWKGKPVDYSLFLTDFTHRSDEQNAAMIYSGLKKRYACALSGSVIATPNRSVLVRIRHEPLSVQEAIDLSLKTTEPTLVVVSSAAKGAVEHISKTGKSVKLIDFNALMEWLAALDSLPPEPVTPPLKTRLFALTRAIFSPSNSKRFFSIGATILSFSLFSGMRLYYLIFGGAAMLVSLTLKIISLRKTEQA